MSPKLEETGLDIRGKNQVEKEKEERKGKREREEGKNVKKDKKLAIIRD